MRPLSLVLLAAAGRGRASLVVACTAVSTALLLIAASILRLPGADGQSYASGPLITGGLIAPIHEPGTRGGAVFGVVLLVLPVLLLLDQAVRLGSSARQRRYAALAVAGATRSDLRRWGIVEVGLPATTGALLGVPLWLLLRYLLGVRLGQSGRGLVPTTVGPGWWALLVLAAVVGYGGWVGLRAGARSAGPLARSRGVRRPPRPWGLALLVLAAVAIGVGTTRDGSVLFFVGLALVVLGLAVLSPWLAYRIALLLVRRASSAEEILALRRLVADARPAGRAAAAIGAVAFAGGVVGPFIGSVLSDGTSDAGFYVGPALLVAGLAALAALVVAGTLAVHSTESVLDRRREMAALVAVGVPVAVVARSQRLEIWVATLPLALLGSFLGAFGYGLLSGLLLWSLVSMAVTLVVVTGAGALAAALVRPWLRDAVLPTNLRTE